MSQIGAPLPGSYDYRLVGLSILIAILASYVALDLAARVTGAKGRAQSALFEQADPHPHIYPASPEKNPLGGRDEHAH